MAGCDTQDVCFPTSYPNNRMQLHVSQIRNPVVCILHLLYPSLSLSDCVCVRAWLRMHMNSIHWILSNEKIWISMDILWFSLVILLVLRTLRTTKVALCARRQGCATGTTPTRSPSHFHQPARVSHQPNKPTVCSPESSKWERKRIATYILHEGSSSEQDVDSQ